MLKLLVSGSYPLIDYIKTEIQKRRDSIPNLTIQEIDSKHLLSHPQYMKDEDILICGVVLAERLRELKVRGQIVPLRVQTQDFFKALVEASKSSSQICIVNYYHEFIEQDDYLAQVDLADLFGMNIRQYIYKSKEHAEEVIQELSEDTQNVIIGSGLIVDIAKRNGLHSVLWYSEKTIELSVSIAFDILSAKMLERGNFKRESVVLEHFQEGVITVNSVNRIVNMNEAARELMELDEPVGHSAKLLSEVISQSELLDELLTQNELKEQIVRYQNKTLLVTKYSIHVNDVLDGSVILMSDVETLQRKENKVRRKLNNKHEGAKYTFDDIIGQSDQMLKAKVKARTFAKAKSNVLILGESGTGKELFAQSIHNASNRVEQPFVAVNCAAIPENLLESEFFGYSDGAFTGALKGGKSGLFEVAHNGTIFLDEIGELPLSMQAKLLRVLQEKNVRRIGSAHAIPIDVRVISATNVNLIEMVKAQKFRMDLYYRIAILNLFLPNLNQRRGDIHLLFKRFVIQNNPALYATIDRFSDAILPMFENHYWEGNVREFENTVERLFAYLDAEDVITEDIIIQYVDESIKENYYLLNQAESVNETFQKTMKELELTKIQEVLDRTNGNKQEAAKILGISRSTLWRKINEIEKAESNIY